jgi:hypothetical protein
MAVTANSVTSTYLGWLQLRSGRAVTVVNLGVAPDLGVLLTAAGGAERVRNFHGRVQINDNQLSVQADARGLPEALTREEAAQASPSEMLAGSAVLATSLDDVSFAGNQVVNEILPPGESVRRVRSTVAALSTTGRTSGNRITEFPFTTWLSYAGAKLAEVVTGNVTTHCIRTVAPRLEDLGNIQLLCEGATSVLRRHVITGS